jgi:hypothetical protein
MRTQFKGISTHPDLNTPTLGGSDISRDDNVATPLETNTGHFVAID